jgi:hypothetical protein
VASESGQHPNTDRASAHGGALYAGAIGSNAGVVQWRPTEVSAVLADAAAVDRLVKALEANKALLPKTPPKDEAAN